MSNQEDKVGEGKGQEGSALGRAGASRVGTEARRWASDIREPLRTFLDEMNARRVATWVLEGLPKNKQRMYSYLIKGWIVNIHDYGPEDGWEAYIPASKSNSVPLTLDALRAFVAADAALAKAEAR